MVTKEQLNVRISQLHRNMLNELCELWGLNEGEAIGLLIDRAWRDHRQAQGLSVYITPSPGDDTRSGQPEGGG